MNTGMNTEYPRKESTAMDVLTREEPAQGQAPAAPAASAAWPLQAQTLHKRYGPQRVLDGVTLAVEPGSILGLVGRNGAGKSTLLECLLGLRAPDAGQAWLWGVPARRLGEAEKTRLGYVPQRPEGFDWLRIEQMLGLVAGLYPRWDQALVQRMLDAAGMDARRRMITLSPGERQQVAIIRALAPRPQLLVLDEPASALDPLARRALLREIVDLAAQEGTTVVFSTHIVSDLERVASHIALLHQGQMRLCASLDDIKDGWRRLWWPPAASLPDAALPAEVSRRPLPEGGWSLLLRLEPGQGDAPGLLDGLPAGARLHPLPLEDLFVEMAGAAQGAA